jgi:homoserine O-acetyltransferase/O-succinyltransferase
MAAPYRGGLFGTRAFTGQARSIRVAVAPLLTERQYVTVTSPEQPLRLECGAALAPVRICYETFGRLSPARDNAILVCHALTGDGHVAGVYGNGDRRPGWWETAVGPGKALDTERYFVICSNVIGGCQGTTGPSDLNPETGRPYGLEFPLVTPRDMVRAQALLLNHLGIDQLLTVIGGSLGAMQAMEWAVTFPDRVRTIIPVAGSGRFHPQGIAWNEVQRQAILNDPHFNGGQYYSGPPPARGLAAARMLGMITYRSDESMWSQFGREIRPEEGMYDAEGKLLPTRRAAPRPPEGADLQRGMGIAYQIESYLHYQGEALVRRFDANSYLYLSRAMDLHDIGRGHGNYEEAHRRIRARVLAIGIRSDLLFPTYQQKETVSLVRTAGGSAEYFEMDSPWGHDAFLVDFHLIAGRIASFLQGA